MMNRIYAVSLVALLAALGGCKESGEAKAPGPQAGEEKPAAAQAPAAAQDGTVEITEAELAFFKPLPKQLTSEKNPITEPKVKLGRMLYYDTRLSEGKQISCNTCHDLGKYGVDPRPGATSEGHNGQRGGRNAPTVYNAANQIAQFWDGRADSVEDQATGPMLNPVEMAMPSGDELVKRLKAVPAYVEMFKAAYPEEKDPVTIDNAGKAIGAFERGLVTVSPFDRYLEGDKTALTDTQKKGLKKFVSLGCTTCHNQMHIGGNSFQKAGLVIPWPNQKDQGRYEVTKKEADKMMFKVPVLWNITETAPYFHDGSVNDLGEAVRMMAKHQLGKQDLSDEDVQLVIAFLGSLKGELPADYIQKPELP